MIDIDRNILSGPVAASALGLSILLGLGCADYRPHHDDQAKPAAPLLASDTRQSLSLSSEAQTEHRAVMLQHLETIQTIVAALADEDYELARGLTEAHLGFFMHRQVMAKQQPENFPPAYHDLAMAHHQAAEDLARIIPSKDMKQILPRLDGVLKACVACHLEYKL